jgi:hypothetical protein
MENYCINGLKKALFPPKPCVLLYFLFGKVWENLTDEKCLSTFIYPLVGGTSIGLQRSPKRKEAFL